MSALIGGLFQRPHTHCCAPESTDKNICVEWNKLKHHFSPTSQRQIALMPMKEEIWAYFDGHLVWVHKLSILVLLDHICICSPHRHCLWKEILQSDLRPLLLKNRLSFIRSHRCIYCIRHQTDRDVLLTSIIDAIPSPSPLLLPLAAKLSSRPSQMQASRFNTAHLVLGFVLLSSSCLFDQVTGGTFSLSSERSFKPSSCPSGRPHRRSRSSSCLTWWIYFWKTFSQKNRETNPRLVLHLSVAYLFACGSNQNYPLIDYLQGSEQRRRKTS